jgi:hypothetical protein
MNHGLPAIIGECKLLFRFNQTEIDSIDQLSWRTERNNLLSRVESFCQNNNITFSWKHSKNVVESSQHDKIVMMWLFDLIPNQRHWEQINNLCKQLNKSCFVITDNIIEFVDLEFVKFFSYPKLLGSTASYDQLLTELPTPTKLYNCFIQRVDAIRQSWFYFLHHHNLIDCGYVSLLMKQEITYSRHTGQELFDYNHHTYQMNQLPHFESAYQSWKDRVPFRNFKETNNLLPLIADSKYSLILETYATEDDSLRWCFTEKVLRDIQFPVIPLLFIQKGGIQKLKQLGFELGSHMDNIDNLSWQDRQTQLLDILINDCVDFDRKQLYNQSRHNQELLESWKLEYQHTGFFDDFYNKVLEY